MFLTKIDDNGMYVEPVILDAIPPLMEEQQIEVTDADGNTTTETQTVPVLVEDSNTIPDPHYIAAPCPSGFYWPRWDGTQWVEGGTAPEPVAPIPTLEEQITGINTALLGLMEMLGGN